MFLLFKIFVTAVFLSLILTPFLKIIAHKFNIIDSPGQRKIHSKPIPLTGGEAIFLVFSLALLLNLGINREIAALLLAGLAFIIFGFLDDAGIKMKANKKILVHLVIALVFVVWSGIHVDLFKQAYINILLTACFFTFMTNSMNMLDGMDGLVAGICFIIGLFFSILAFNSKQTDVMFFSLAISGASLGFLRYNFNPASVFLGEAGSTFIGFVLAVLAVKLNVFGLWDVALTLGINRLQSISFIIPLILLGIPIFDTYFVFINRYINNIKFSQAGKDHSHHRIHLMGFSQKATVLTIYSIQIILGAIALSMINSDIIQFFSLLTIVAIIFLVFSVFLLRIDVYS